MNFIFSCGEVNFASKSECFKCSVDKKDAQDEALRYARSFSFIVRGIRSTNR